MAKPLLVVVTGPPASGKSGLARDRAAELSIPFLSKDELKERLDEPADAAEVRRKIEAGFWDPLDLPGELILLRPTEAEPDVKSIASRSVFSP